MSENNLAKSESVTKLMSYGMLVIATLGIFIFSQFILAYLVTYELNAMYISFCAGFILFVPLVSLVLHPTVLTSDNHIERFKMSTLLANIGLVSVVQCLFFLIWITDAIAIYSIYVDQSSFLAKAFNVTSESKTDLSVEFYWSNLLLAWLFACLSLTIGVLPCLISRINNIGVVKNFVAGFSFAKNNKLKLIVFGFLLSFSVIFPLLYSKYLFLLSFPIALALIVKRLSHDYFISVIK